LLLRREEESIGFGSRRCRRNDGFGRSGNSKGRRILGRGSVEDGGGKVHRYVFFLIDERLSLRVRRRTFKNL